MKMQYETGKCLISTICSARYWHLDVKYSTFISRVFLVGIGGIPSICLESPQIWKNWRSRGEGGASAICKKREFFL